MDKEVNGLKKDLEDQLFAYDLEAVVLTIKKFHQHVLRLRLNDQQQEQLSNLFFAESVEKIKTSPNVHVNIAFLVLEGSGHSINDFLKQRTKQMPFFLVNGQLFHHALKSGLDIIKKKHAGHVNDVLVSIANIGRFYQLSAANVAKLFLKNEPDQRTVIWKRYHQASTASFDQEVIKSINHYCHKVLFNKFFLVLLDELYSADTDTEFAQYLVMLLELLKESRKNNFALITKNIAISKINLFKHYVDAINKLCHQEKVIDIEEFLKSPIFASLSKFLAIVDELSAKLVNHVERDKSKVPAEVLDIITFIETLFVNYVCYPIFEQLKTKRCYVSMYHFLSLFGTKLLDSKFDAYIPPLRLIDIKYLLTMNVGWLKTKLQSLMTQLIYFYFKAHASNAEFVALLTRLEHKGFAPQLIIPQFMHAAALMLRENGDRNVMEKIADIMGFVNTYARTYKYKLDNYEDLIGNYLRTYELIDLMNEATAHEALIKKLLNEGIEINLVDFEEKTPLIYAIEHDSQRDVKALLDKGADPNLAGFDGNTPMIIAIEKNNLTNVNLLLENNAEPALENIYGINAFSLAQERPLIESLLKNARDNYKKLAIKEQIDVLAALQISIHFLALHKAARL